MSLNPRSRLAAILRALDAALHPIRSARAYRNRRAAYDLYRPRHAAPEAPVHPASPFSDAELAALRSGTRRAVAATASAMTGDYVTLDQILARDDEPLDLYSCGPVEGGYVGFGGERVAA